jgi:hypothetical protein
MIYLDVPLALFPNEEETKIDRKLDDIPSKLVKFSDVLDTLKVAILPSFKNTDHRIDLVLGTTLLVGPLYPLS